MSGLLKMLLKRNTRNTKKVLYGLMTDKLYMRGARGVPA